MTIGILASRYAKALYGFACEQGVESKVYKEMKYLAYQLINVPELRRYINNPMLKPSNKIDMLVLASGENVSDTTKQFIKFLFDREKIEFLLYISMAYQTVYRKAKNIVLAQFVSAHESDEYVLEKIKKIIVDTFGDKVDIELETRVNPNLIGGFRLTVEDKRLDASVSGELKRLKKALTQ